MSQTHENRVAIVGASGPTGWHLTRELLGRGRRVRVISRRRDALEAAFAGCGAEIVGADALDPAALRRALDGCATAVDCIGLPAQRMADHPRTARVLAGVVRERGLKCLQVSSYWSYLPQSFEVMDEGHPRRNGNALIRARREAEDVLRADGAAIAHLPDFFGPRVHASTLQNALADAAAGRPMAWIGGPTVAREHAFLPDSMRLVADLLERDEAFGGDWALPGSGGLTARQAAAIAGRHLGREVRVRAAAPWLLRLVALVSRDLRAFLPMVPHYVTPVRYRAARLEALLGRPLRSTPYDEAIPATLDWLGARRA